MIVLADMKPVMTAVLNIVAVLIGIFMIFRNHILDSKPSEDRLCRRETSYGSCTHPHSQEFLKSSEFTEFGHLS
jgi:hypothetical protein